MAGNDIVDLAEAAENNNWRRTGYLDKIFTVKEKSYILNSENPGLMVWLFWSMKESAYKLYVRKNQVRFYSPLKFECGLKTLSYLIEGKVCYQNNSYETFSSVTTDYISTTAIPGISSVKILYQDNIEFISKDFREQQRELYSTLIKIILQANPDLHSLNIKKNHAGVPFIYQGDLKLNYCLSISHHGRFGSFVIS
jgi:phosphopantetheinyl transferase (holo-ACP synthase)